MKVKLLFSLLFLSISMFSQSWIGVPETTKTTAKPTLSDYQKSFNEYWADKNVKDGYYIENGIKKKAYGWKQFLRWEYYWESRVNPQTGEFPSSEQYATALNQYKQNNLERSASGNWTNLGPSSSNGGYRGVGRINCIAFHPTDNNTFWVGTPAGGLWKTTNGGNTWTVLTDQNDVLGVSSVIIPSDYETSNTIYIGTGDRDHKDNHGIGVLKSTDGGNTWHTTGLVQDLSDAYSVNQMLIDPTNNNILYAATSTGIYKTTNAGNNWTKILNDYYIADIEFKPNDPSIIYASGRWYAKIYKLTNNGSNVSTVYSNNSGDGAQRIELTVTAANPNIVYAVVTNSESGLRKILKSIDSGSSYSAVFTPGNPPTASQPNILSNKKNGDATGGQGSYDLTLIADPNNENILYCGGVNTWKSTDGGVSWELNNYWTPSGCSGCEIAHADKHYFAYNGSTLFECNDGGLYKTNDGSNWTSISNGIKNSQIYKLSVSQTVANATLTGLQDNGSKLLKPNGTWKDVKGGDGMECIIDYSNYNIQYATYVRGQITRTMNLWSNKTDIEPSNAGNGAWVTPYIIHPSEPTILYAGYANVWKTTNRGNAWTKISNINSSDKLRSMAISISNPDNIYVADKEKIWKSINAGNNWTNITNNLPSSNVITSIAVKHDDPNTVWVSLGGYNSNVVYQTTNGGTNWTNISTGLPNIPASTIVENKDNTNETELYLGTDYGVYVKLGNSNWALFNTGLPKVVVSELDIYYDDNSENNKIRAATYGRGLWESDLIGQVDLTVDFSANNTTISEGEMVTFTDLSTGSPTSWQWEFEGGEPANSDVQNPTVTYNTAGTYQVKLTVSNATSSDDETKIDYIQVNDNSCDDLLSDYSMGFEENENISGWTLEDVNDDDTTWALYNSAAYAHSGDRLAGIIHNPDMAMDDYLYTKCFDLNDNNQYELSFWYRVYNSSSPEKIEVKYGTATNHSQMLNTIIDLESISNDNYTQATATFSPAQTGEYYIGFHGYSDANMQYLFIDDINIKDVTLSCVLDLNKDNINVYPNPSNGLITISGIEDNKALITIIDVTGRTIFKKQYNSISNTLSINLAEQNEGIYKIIINQDNKTINKTIVLQR